MKFFLSRSFFVLNLKYNASIHFMRYAMNHHHRSLKIEILKNFPTQSDFASAINEHESKVSQVLRGRRKLSPIDAEKWKQILNCPQALIESVTDYK